MIQSGRTGATELRFDAALRSDCAVQPGWIAAALAGFVAHPAAVVLCGRRRERFPEARLYPMYGLTEAFRSTYLAPSLVDAHPESMGQAIPFAGGWV